MQNTKMVPSLSEDGWVNSPEKTADYLLSHFFVSDYSQTQFYLGNVSSLQWILQNTQDDLSRTIRDLTDTLNVYFSRYFSNVVTEVKEVESKESSSKAELTIYIQFTDNTGKVHVAGKLLQYSDTIIDKIITLSNG